MNVNVFVFMKALTRSPDLIEKDVFTRSAPLRQKFGPSLLDVINAQITGLQVSSQLCLLTIGIIIMELKTDDREVNLQIHTLRS